MQGGRQVAVVGAAGHTGRLVVQGLLERGLAPVAIARDAAALSAAGFHDLGVACSPIPLEDPDALAAALRGASVVINCAGPFAKTAERVAAAALRSGAHYIDVSSEHGPTEALLGAFHKPARAAGLVVVPSVAVHGGLADLLVTAAMRGWDNADFVQIATGMRRGRPTKGMRATLTQAPQHEWVISNRRLAPAPPVRGRRSWSFGGAVGNQTVSRFAFNEPGLVARHLKVGELRSYLSVDALADLVDPNVPVIDPADELTTAWQRFAMEVVVTRGRAQRRVTLDGRDPYAFSARMAIEAAERLMRGQFRAVGASTAGEIFEADSFLRDFNVTPVTADPLPA